MEAAAVLDATRAWIESPTPTLRLEWAVLAFANDGVTFDKPFWAPNPEGPENAILAASRLIPNAREIAAASVLWVLL